MSAGPSKLGRYLVRAKLGEGGMAIVYVGLVEGAPAGSGTAALKLIKDEFSFNPDFSTMFLDEAKLVSRLVHPNIVRIYELGVDPPTPTRKHHRLFLAMELLSGQSLWDVWEACRARGVRLRYDMLAWIGSEVARALHHAHELRDDDGHLLDLVHRDVNATNIFVTYDGKVKVIDFGLAKARTRLFQTAAGIIKGKTAYMSPEQAVGQPLDRRTDIFALGTTLWELSTDQRLFKMKDDVETLKRVYAADVPDPRALVEGYPDDLWGVLRGALARERTDRFSNAGAMAEALATVARESGRGVGEGDVAAVMHALFAAEIARQAEFLRDASHDDRPPPRYTLRPPSQLRGVHIADTKASMAPLPLPMPGAPAHTAATPGTVDAVAAAYQTIAGGGRAPVLPAPASVGAGAALSVGPDGLFAASASRPGSSRDQGSSPATTEPSPSPNPPPYPGHKSSSPPQPFGNTPQCEGTQVSVVAAPRPSPLPPPPEKATLRSSSPPEIAVAARKSTPPVAVAGRMDTKTVPPARPASPGPGRLLLAAVVILGAALLGALLAFARGR